MEKELPICEELPKETCYEETCCDNLYEQDFFDKKVQEYKALQKQVDDYMMQNLAIKEADMVDRFAQSRGGYEHVYNREEEYGVRDCIHAIHETIINDAYKNVVPHDNIKEEKEEAPTNIEKQNIFVKIYNKVKKLWS